ncbi:MAG: pyridoxal-phosphate dependent enzyme [Myxococcota bacterium]
MTWRIEDHHLAAARSAIADHLSPTPLRRAPQLGDDVWLKLECLQVTGSFKVRGALTKMASLSSEERAAGVVTASAGNHGLGVAFAAARLGIHARILVPAETPVVKRDGIARAGAEVVVCPEPGYDDVEARALELARASGATFVSAFDDPFVAAGNGGTVGDELQAQLEGIEVIVCPVGGGGMVCGLAAAFPSPQLIGVNTDASPGMARSFAEGRALERLPPATTLAEGLEGGVREATYRLAREAGVKMTTVGEDAIADAMRFARDELSLVVEGSGAVGIAYVRARTVVGRTVVVVTGSNVDEERLNKV